MEKDTYKADDITILEGLEPVRKRPGMYIGSTGPDGLHTMVREIFDNSRDEAMAGFADKIEVCLMPNNIIRVADNGRGIPVDKHKKTGLSALDTIMTTLHAGGKFGDSGYKISGGLHGVGASVVNALSIWTKVKVSRENEVFIQEYKRGDKNYVVKKTGQKFSSTGTVFSFQADDQIFNEINYSYKRIVTALRSQAYLVKGLKISVYDFSSFSPEEIKEDDFFFLEETNLPAYSETFYFEGGLISLVKFLNKNQKSIHKNIFYVRKEINEEKEAVEISFQYVDDISNRVFAYANNILNTEGGFHLTGLKNTLTRTINSYAKKNNIIKDKQDPLQGDDLLEGITVVVSIHLRDPQFEGQTKGKLGSMEAKGMVENVFGQSLTEFLEENPEDAKAIINKGIIAMKARLAAKAAKDSVLRKGVLEGLNLPGKLADCQSKKPEDSEMFIVEGESAGGTAKQGRDRKTQAVLSLKGKILNVEKVRLDRILASEPVKNLTIALGTGIGDTFDVSKIRYHKIIVATDADVDGSHIRALLLTLFYRYFRPIIEYGYLYIAQPPLYKIKKGKEEHYAYSDKEKKEILSKMGFMEEENFDLEIQEGEEIENQEENENKGEKSKPLSGLRISRYKGLGEMNRDELYDTTMDIKKRILKKVSIEDAASADAIFDTLMGSEVAPRKSFIVANAKNVQLN